MRQSESRLLFQNYRGEWRKDPHKNGRSIFGCLMEQEIVAKKKYPLFGNLISKIEVFLYLISAAKNWPNLRITWASGNDIFSFVSNLSEKISGCILDRSIDVVFVDDRWWLRNSRSNQNLIILYYIMILNRKKFSRRESTLLSLFMTDNQKTSGVNEEFLKISIKSCFMWKCVTFGTWHGEPAAF